MSIGNDKPASVIAKLVQQQKDYNKLFLAKEKSTATTTVVTETLKAETKSPSIENSSSSNRDNKSKSNSLFAHFLKGLPFVNLFSPSAVSSKMQPASSSSSAVAAGPQATNKSETSISYSELDVTHDKEKHLFLIEVSKDITAALCYLPTRVQNVVEVYHIEIPASHRNKGLGDKLVRQCLQWAEQNNQLLIPNCQFMRQYLAAHETEEQQKFSHVIVKNEEEGRERPRDQSSPRNT